MALPIKIICICLNPTIDRVLRVPEIQGGAHVLGETLLRQPAGKAVNVCRSLARLGSDSMVLGFVGQNEVNWFTHELTAMQPGRIHCRWLPLAQPTRESVTLIAADTGLDMHIREPGFTLTAEHWGQLEHALLGVVQPGDLCAFAGSPPR
ncbi:MAG: hypothetical protein HC898_12000, partial [Phycisphaerales bacterium]|nr:hypothetical protein [Phycisphaerales bacterium]